MNETVVASKKLSFFQRLFHRHVWQEMEETFLREEREEIPTSFHSLQRYGQYKYTAIEQKCLVCDKVRIITKRYIVLP